MRTIVLPFVAFRQPHLTRWRIGEALARLATRLVASWELRPGVLLLSLNVTTEEEAEAFVLAFLHKLAEVYNPYPFIPNRDE